MTKWLHTINGCPASFKGTQIVYSYQKIKLADSLRQIKEEQARSIAWRIKRGFGMENTDYNHVTIKVE